MDITFEKPLVKVTLARYEQEANFGVKPFGVITCTSVRLILIADNGQAFSGELLLDAEESIYRDDLAQ
jgi:hypothetical protein